MITNAYYRQLWAKGKAPKSVKPSDIEHSPLTKTIAVFKKDETKAAT